VLRLDVPRRVDKEDEEQHDHGERDLGGHLPALELRRQIERDHSVHKEHHEADRIE
jgi:hypothetical protein